MLSFRTPTHRFQFRTAAIVERDGAILLHRARHEDFWTLPGGRVEPGESAQDALAREFVEEIGEALAVGPLAVVTENFFEYQGEPHHELGFFFQASLGQDSRLMTGPGPYDGFEDSARLVFEWFPRGAIAGLQVKPEFLKGMLAGPINGLRHVVHRDPVVACVPEVTSDRGPRAVGS